MTAHQERELKFELDSADAVENAARRAFTDGAARHVADLETVYFDTPDLDLRARGMVFRVRRSGRRYYQTIKRQAGSGSFRRFESERQIAGPRPEIGLLDESELSQAVPRGGKLALEPIFTVRSHRTSWTGQSGQNALEFALDRGEILAAGRSTPLFELEIELKRGRTRALFDAARRLGESAGIRPTVFTKDERGYRLFEDSWGRPVRADAPHLEADMPVQDAFRAIAYACMQHFMLNEFIVRRGFDSEAIHQARVATRRLRSALGFFSPILRGEGFDAVRGHLKWLSSELGAARDLDVFLARTAAPRAAAGDLIGAGALAEHIARERAQKYRALAAALESDRCRQALLEMLEWFETGAWAGRAQRKAAAQTVAEFSSRRMSRKVRRLTKHADDLPKMNDDALHDIRKTAKSLRYAAEFHRQLAPRGRRRARFRSVVARLESVQQVLGKQHDRAAARALLVAIVARAGESPPLPADMFFAAGHIAAEMDRPAGDAVKKAAADLKKLAEADPFIES